MNMDDTPPNISTNQASYKTVLEQKYQALLDSTTPFVIQRWGAFTALLLVFVLRILIAQGWYIICYALGIYLLNLFLAFLTPRFDPALEEEIELEDDADEGPSLPTTAEEEFRPFVRRLPEFKFWYSATRATLIALFCSLFTALDLPVFWPILLLYFIILFVFTMKRQIQHMIKYRYLPFTTGKKQYTRAPGN
ncbi:retrieval of early ER protein Rer1 [Basidiobolus meristosporus CBS 931.73]|uniref:Protein RER1 n=1 Tax=Basidiobolus meristosporus CBS 931.73 TaxID=1314790 RepID=A0A1Y1XAD6_9FUNG|nr:retrieval of early ER protein Rer1 [Basidiobolus meristosporus CBS 931.73]|eukprot:ORX82314.1 retrieval of early ER protein Rer1 [Basidiobolus meristosporus CBS 931.73]